MLVTEAEAKHKACCKMPPHREDGKLVTPACLASNCMAWVFSGKNEVYREYQSCADFRAIEEPPCRPENVPQDWEFLPYDPDIRIREALWHEPEESYEKRKKEQRRGYCGLVSDNAPNE
jgi:hypothetical protein